MHCPSTHTLAWCMNVVVWMSLPDYHCVSCAIASMALPYTITLTSLFAMVSLQTLPTAPDCTMACCAALMPAGTLAAAVTAVLCTHFRVPHVLRLGYGPVQGLIQAADDEASVTAVAATPADSVAVAAAVASVTGGATGAAAGAGSGIACWSALALTSNGEQSWCGHNWLNMQWGH